MAFTLLDSFKREETPLEGVKWKLLAWCINRGRTLTEVGWQAKKEAGENSGAYWNKEEFKEPKVRYEFHQGNESGSEFVWVCLTPGVSEATRKGYRFRLKNAGSENKFKMLIEKVNGATVTLLVESAAQTLTNNPEKFECEVRGGKVKFLKNGVVIIEATDSTFTEGFIAVEGDTTGVFGITNLEAEAAGHTEFTETLSATQAQSVTLKRSISRALAPSQPQTPTQVRALARSFSATQAQVATVAAAASAAGELSATQPQTPSMTRALPKALSLSQNQSPVIRRDVGRKLTMTQAQTAAVNEETVTGAAANALSMVL